MKNECNSGSYKNLCNLKNHYKKYTYVFVRSSVGLIFDKWWWWVEFESKKYHDLARIRTWNLLIRSQTRYPLRHKAFPTFTGRRMNVNLVWIVAFSPKKTTQKCKKKFAGKTQKMKKLKGVKGTDGVRTRDLRFTRPTPYHLATAPTDRWPTTVLFMKLIKPLRPQ